MALEETEVASDPDVELSSQDIFRVIEDSVVFIEAPDGESSGSGIVIDGGWILTNAHVVERFSEMRIGRSDGIDLGLHGVHAVDWTFDLALVGPLVDDSLVAIQRGESSDLDIGTRVLLAGFPDEDSRAPTPTLTEGIVSRQRRVALGDFPFLQVDATIAPGQSGGALVNGSGELVGISGLEFGRGEFGLVFAADAMWPRIDDLIASSRSELPSGIGATELTDEVGPLRNFSFAIEVDESGVLDLEVEATADVWLDVQTLGGFTVNQSEASQDPFRGLGSQAELYVDDVANGDESISAVLDPGNYQAVVGSFDEEVTTITVRTNQTIRRFLDAEEGRTLPTGQVVEGSFDWSRDTDRWELPLTAGQQVSITSDGISDTVLVVRFEGQTIGTSDDEGTGLFGTGSQIDFVADQTGTYVIEVGTFDNDRWGYLIQADVN